MTQGIYGYMDLETREVVYIGKDSRIDIDRRHKHHMYKSKYDSQQINKVLQNNPDRYKYARIIEGNFDEELLNGLEMQYIEACKPKFNFTNGGDGTVGFKHSEETKIKISGSCKGKTRSTETRKNMSKAQKGRTVSAEHRNKISESLSKTINTSGYYRVYKKKEPRCKNGFTWIYSWYDENGKKHEISSVDINKLEQKVKAKGLKWMKI